MLFLRFLPRLAAILLVAAFCSASTPALHATETKTLPLSGLGEPGEAPVFWDFKIDAGRRAGEWAKIRVPSNWETEGFGTFYYGVQGRGKPDTDPVIPREQGTYRTNFTVPADWQGSAIRIVFDAAMTDTTVTINGQPAGRTHQGGFYRFHYDITPLVKIGAENTLEVLVAKESANTSVNRAERRGDYWAFGGIYRPVWLEARPQQHIEWTAIDARADGSFTAHIHLGTPLSSAAAATVTAQILDDKNQPVGAPFTASLASGVSSTVVTGSIENPKLWTAETPHLYRVRFSFSADGKSAATHTVTERFGFRTFEVRKNDGLYLNGTKIVLKGVNRHCFWPETGRTVTREQSYADARHIKAANMNAVRMAHYPPDRHFLEACDELGLYVLDELAGWQGFYDTPTGARLIGQMIRRDVNHPSILFWDNGNEGGWNTDNDGEFAKWDPQNRPVLHPWAVHSEINTDHYEKYASTVKLSAGPQIFMPTEFLHGLYDGGIGAGFRDYWDVMGKSPTVAGGFFWAWSDEGVVRTDQGGRIDNFGNNAPDGMVGPHRELEGSYHAVKEIWSPVQMSLPTVLVAGFDFSFLVTNQYAFTNLKDCSFELQWLKFPSAREFGKQARLIRSTKLVSPDIAPGKTGSLLCPIMQCEEAFDAIRVVARDASNMEIASWLAQANQSIENVSIPGAKTKVQKSKDVITLTSGDRSWVFDRKSGVVKKVQVGNATFEMVGGPRFVAYHRRERQYVDQASRGQLSSIDARIERDETIVDLVYEGDLRRVTWRFQEGLSSVRMDYEFSHPKEADIAGIQFDLADTALKSKRWLGRGPYRVWQNRQEGGIFDVHEVAFNNATPGQIYAYPEFKGFFHDWRWLALKTTNGRILVYNETKGKGDVPFFALGKIASGEKDLITDWPDMGLAFLHAIPAIGTKFEFPEHLGPQSQPAKLNGVQRGTLIFRFESE